MGPQPPERPLRVLLVTQHFPPERSGNASRASDMTERLAELGADVTVLCPHPTFPHGAFPRSWRRSRDGRAGAVRRVNLWTWQPRRPSPSFVSRVAYYALFALHAALWALVHRRRYDVIVTSSPPVFTHLAGLAARRPWLVEMRDSWVEGAAEAGFIRKGGLLHRASRAFERACLRRADRIGTTTLAMAESVRATYPGLDGDKFVFLPNGVDTGLFRPSDAPRAPRVVYAGNIGVIQDLDLVLLAMREVRREVPGAKLVLVGGGDAEPALRALAAREGLEDAVEFLGVRPREEIPGILASAMVGVAPIKKMPATRLVIPTKAYEYMAAGTPFVACGDGEIRLLCERAGGVLADNTVESIAAALKRLLADEGERRKRAEQGREHVVAHYDRRAIARRMHAALREVAARA